MTVPDARDGTGRKLAEKYWVTQFHITRLLSEAASFDFAAPEVLRIVCENLGWGVAAIWTVQPGSDALRCSGFWRLPSVQVPAFEAASWGGTFAPGVGLPGRVWTTRAPVWVPDVARDDTCPRAPTARREGLHGACGFPVTAPGEVVGAIEFFSQEVREPDPDLLVLMADVGGQLGGFIERRRAEEALRRAEEKYRAIFENAVEGIFQTTPEGRFLTANPAMARMLGHRSPMELITETVDIEKQIYVDPARRLQFKKIMEEGGSVQGFSTRVYRKDGSVIWLSIASRAVRDAAGRVLYYEGTAEDCTERRRAEEVEEQRRSLLEKSALEWEATFDSMEVPILIVDREGKIGRVNRAALALCGHCAHAEIMGRGVTDVGTGEPWKKAGEMAAHVASTGSALNGQAYDPLSGKTWDITARPSPDPGGEGERVIMAAQDVTRTIELQRSLRRSETMSTMGMLVAGVAHEVRNPLFSISATLDALEAQLGREGKHGPYIDVLRKELERLTRLMKNLLAYGKPPAPEFSDGAIEGVIAQAVHAYQPLAKASRVGLLNKVRYTFPPISMDRGRLLAVFQNLIENAIQHSPAGGTVIIEAEQAREDGSTILCTVKDSGPGFREEDLQRLFEPFFTRRRGGTGLGLAIAQRIVQEHGAIIGASNRAEGGAVVSLRFPLPARTP